MFDCDAIVSVGLVLVVSCIDPATSPSVVMKAGVATHSGA